MVTAADVPIATGYAQHARRKLSTVSERTTTGGQEKLDIESNLNQHDSGLECPICIGPLFVSSDHSTTNGDLPTHAASSHAAEEGGEVNVGGSQNAIGKVRTTLAAFKRRISQLWGTESAPDESPEDDILTLKKCQHAFHARCLSSWFLIERSSRRIHDVKKVTDPGAGMGPTQTDVSTAPPAKRRQLSRKMQDHSQTGVRFAMRELSEMENRLQNSTRTQRLTIEASHVTGADKQSGKGKVWRPTIETGPANPEERVREVEEERSGTPDLDVAPIEGPQAEGAIGDVEDDKYREDDAPERGAARVPPVNSDYLPLPWTGRLGYACLNTYLRAANPPVFSSRTCRIASIIQHRHPLADPSQPEHATKNRPDDTKPADIALGQKYVQELGLANARDIVKMLRWNDKYGIKFMRLSSEMFPFASHEEYGYRLEPFAADVLAEAGKVATRLGHRLTTHPGQFTQLGSPRKEVITNAVRDLDYHDELLSLLRLPEQENRDAIMILHMGGTYGDKAATLDRFRANYAKLKPSVKNRLVLENDDVSWSVHDLLPICEELNIPMVLDFHHHNIVFDAKELREGTEDIRGVFDRIRATWTRKGIRQKMHYSESCPGAISPRDRRKHSPRVRTLPPCSPDMDLMIEAKDKEQAVFELMRTFKLPGYDLINDIIPFEREDEVRANKNGSAKKPKKSKKKVKDEDGDDEMGEAGPIEVEAKSIPPEEFGMGGPSRRVYWPEGMEEWLKPKKREIKRKQTTTVNEES
ncbi:uv-endonuclease uve-1 [Colletotrichum karsti]|uniref:Uv-endonuclease uve-1 n=1 Tax=Colletotrichum karsti TaxID=1095194 RepID=A0A9P6LM69_9PEZI|nr:uv-endonuclease uve-1 [Colletotrichum karsti]KAF9877247.1 uv-endonuclease uve-1 [Colletotrichum karsti]